MKNLVKFYEENLVKVKKMYPYSECDCILKKDKCKAYVLAAEKHLEEVKNGRKW